MHTCTQPKPAQAGGCVRECGGGKPADVCQFYYECPSCNVLLRPQPGVCCVFCSYRSVKCPPMQHQAGCC
ncbi:GDCCVxC domain-containing (seleno)protein [Pseudomonas sp. BF-R-19]|uniref:GDCCVxC domain-containing (seleno)protein n=1 Tax=Pseudomonas sp. BF-R-19 TaxID=2832397 RepID=UPI003989EC20